MTGIDGHAGQIVDQVAGVWCNTPEGVAAGTASEYVPVGAGGQGGNYKKMSCGKNQAIGALSAASGKNDKLPGGNGLLGMQYACVDLDDAGTPQRNIMRGPMFAQGSANWITFEPYYFVTGLDFWAGDYINGLSFGAADFSRDINPALFPDEAAKCCVGTRTAMCDKVTDCRGVMTQWCRGAGVGTEECKIWCRDNPAVCDDAVTKWCADPAHSADPYCACINSAANNPAMGINPKCVDAACIRSGYLTSGMSATACPDLVTCNVQNYLNNSGVQMSSGVTPEQNCGGSGGAAVAASGAVIGGAAAGWSMSMILLIVFVFVVIVGIVIAMMMRRPAAAVSG